MGEDTNITVKGPKQFSGTCFLCQKNAKLCRVCEVDIPCNLDPTLVTVCNRCITATEKEGTVSWE